MSPVHRATDVPTIDDADDPDPPNAAYPDFTPSDTFVVSGPLGPDAKWKGPRFNSLGAVRRYLVQKYGRVHEVHTLEDRWFGRVPRPKENT